MNGLSWSVLAIIVVVCHMTAAAPSLRVKRGDELSLDPVNIDDSNKQEVDREKRKLGEASFQSKNAVLGFVFGKIDQFIDAKTRFIDQLDKGNIEKNRQHHIEAPQPVPNFQALISGIITPKISAITQKFGSLSSGLIGGAAGSSGSLSGGSGGSGHSSGGDDDASGGSQAGGLSGILSSVLRLSGPILSSSLGGGASSSGSGSFDSTTEADDDF